MGGNFQSSLSEQISESYFSMITSITAQAATRLNLTNEQINNLTINFCEPPCGRVCIAQNITSNQTNTLQQSIDAQTLSKVVADVKNEIVNQTWQWVQQQDSSTQGWLSVAFNVQINDQVQVNKVSEKIANSISDDTSTACAGFNFEENNQTLNLCGTVGTITANQSNAIISAVSCITNQVLNSSVFNSEYASSIQRADQQAYSEQQGIFGWLETIAIIIALIVIVFIIAHMLIHLSGGYKPKNVPQLNTAQQPAQGMYGATQGIQQRGISGTSQGVQQGMQQPTRGMPGSPRPTSSNARTNLPQRQQQGYRRNYSRYSRYVPSGRSAARVENLALEVA